MLQSLTPVSGGLPPRVITFQYAQNQGYCLELGTDAMSNHYMRFYFNGSPIVKAAVTITGITQANPAVFSTTLHGLSTGDWIATSGNIQGMTEMDNRFFVVTVLSTTTFSVAMLNGTPVDSTTFAAWTGGGQIAAIYRIATPWALADVPLLKFAESADVMSIVHPSYPQYDLERISGNDWTLTQTSFGAALPPPNGLGLEASNTPDPSTSPPIQPAAYAYVVTTVAPNGEESIASGIANITGAVDMAVTAGSNTVSWSAVGGAAYYNIYRAPTSYNTLNGSTTNALPVPLGAIFSYVGSSYGTQFVDSNIIPDTTQVPPIHENPFAIGQIVGTAPVTAGSGYTTAAVTITTSTGSGAVILPIIQSGTIAGYIVQSTGSNYLITDTATVTGDGSGAAVNLIVGPASGTYPSVAAYYQQRRIYAASNNQPDTFWGSKPGYFTNFDSGIPVEASDAITATPWSQQVNGIAWMLQEPGGLVVMTGLGLWLVNGVGGSGLNPQPLTPSSDQALPQMTGGISGTVPPLAIYNDILFVRSKGYTVCSVIYNYFTNNYAPTDQTVLSGHLFLGYDIVQWAWAEEPFNLIWAVRSDGILLSFTYLKEQEVFAWGRHDTSGSFASVTAVAEPPVDALYCVVERTSVSGSFYFIERMDNRVWLDSEAPFCVDAGIANVMGTFNVQLSSNSITGPVTFTAVSNVFSAGNVGAVLRIAGGIAVISAYTSATQISGTWVLSPGSAVRAPETPAPFYRLLMAQGTWTLTSPQTQFYGYDHLIDDQVSALADGVPVTGLTVAADGSVTLPFAASNVKIGLGFTAQVQTPYIDAGSPTVQGRRKNVIAVSARVEASQGVQVGTNQPDGAAQQPLQIAPPWTGMQLDPAMVTGAGSPVSTYTSPGGQVVSQLYTGDLRSNVLASWNVRGQVAVQQVGPQPLNLLSVEPELLEGDTAEQGYSPERDQKPRQPSDLFRGPGLHMLMDG